MNYTLLKKDDYLSLCNKNFPYIHPLIYKRFLSNDECDEILRNVNMKKYNDSTVEDSKNKNNVRKSKTVWLYIDQDPIVNEIYKKLENIIKIPVKNYEHLQVVKYDKYDFFKVHYDQCLLKYDYCKKELERFNNKPRLLTLLIYLNDGYEYVGGETNFPNINFKFKGNKGDAILFHNLDESKRYIHPYSLHEGKPIIKGVKWICNIWIRN